jgi:hypothetical protein
MMTGFLVPFHSPLVGQLEKAGVELLDGYGTDAKYVSLDAIRTQRANICKFLNFSAKRELYRLLGFTYPFLASIFLPRKYLLRASNEFWAATSDCLSSKEVGEREKKKHREKTCENLERAYRVLPSFTQGVRSIAEQALTQIRTSGACYLNLSGVSEDIAFKVLSFIAGNGLADRVVGIELDCENRRRGTGWLTAPFPSLALHGKKVSNRQRIDEYTLYGRKLSRHIRLALQVPSVGKAKSPALETFEKIGSLIEKFPQTVRDMIARFMEQIERTGIAILDLRGDEYSKESIDFFLSFLHINGLDDCLAYVKVRNDLKVNISSSFHSRSEGESGQLFVSKRLTPGDRQACRLMGDQGLPFSVKIPAPKRSDGKTKSEIAELFEADKARIAKLPIKVQNLVRYVIDQTGKDCCLCLDLREFSQEDINSFFSLTSVEHLGGLLRFVRMKKETTIRRFLSHFPHLKNATNLVDSNGRVYADNGLTAAGLLSCVQLAKPQRAKGKTAPAGEI